MTTTTTHIEDVRVVVLRIDERLVVRRGALLGLRVVRIGVAAVASLLLATGSGSGGSCPLCSSGGSCSVVVVTEPCGALGADAVLHTSNAG